MGHKDLNKSVALFALATVSGLGMAQTALADPTVKWPGGLETREDDRRFHVSGRYMYDIENVDDDRYADPFTRSFTRRAFLGVDGRLTEHWRYNLKWDLTPGAAGNAVKADDFYLEYADNWGSIFIGNNNAVSPMEDRDSSLNIPFNERSMIIQALGFGKRTGVAFLTNGGNWSAGVAVAQNDAAENATNDLTSGNEGLQYLARGTWAPIYSQTPDGTTVLHIGVNTRFRDNGGADQDANGATPGGNFSYNSRAAADALNTNEGDRAFSVGGTGQDFTYGVEAAFQWNAFGIEAEYQHLNTRGAKNGASTGLGSNADASASGYYVDLFWSPTGESRNYKASDGSFGAVTPLRPLGSGGIGHIMLAARYERADFTDDQFSGVAADVNGIPNVLGMVGRAEATAYTLGATWVPVEHVKFQLNYALTSIDDEGNGVIDPEDQDSRVISLRTQFDF